MLVHLIMMCLNSLNNSEKKIHIQNAEYLLHRLCILIQYVYDRMNPHDSSFFSLTNMASNDFFNVNSVGNKIDPQNFVPPRRLDTKSFPAFS